MLAYEFDRDMMAIEKSMNEDDFEFRFRFRDKDWERRIQKVRSHYANNRIHTDVLFYTHKDHEYQVIVRNDFLEDFLITLFKYRLLTSLAWKEE